MSEDSLPRNTADKSPDLAENGHKKMGFFYSAVPQLTWGTWQVGLSRPEISWYVHAEVGDTSSSPWYTKQATENKEASV